MASTYRARFRHVELMPVRSPFNDADHLRDDIAAALDQHFIADLGFQSRDLILVVQRGSRDRDAADRYRREVSDRCQRAGAAHVHLNIFERRYGLPRRILESDSPTRRLCREAKLALLPDGIYLHDDSVDLVRQALALLFPVLDKPEKLLQVGAL